MEQITITCKICHRDKLIDTAKPEIYDKRVVRNNFVCDACRPGVRVVSIKLECAKCYNTFSTKAPADHVSEYSKWKCPACVSGEPITPKNRNKSKTDIGCHDCRRSRGVCFYPEEKCKYNANFVKFDASSLNQMKESASVLTVHEVDEFRDDIHFLKYTPLVQPLQALAKGNLVIIRCREGSKKNYITHLNIYKYDDKKAQFVAIFNHQFPKEADWVAGMKPVVVKYFKKGLKK